MIRQSAVLLLIPPLMALGCGGLAVDPLRQGAIVGRLTEGDPSLATVFVLEQPERQGSVEDDGTFEIDEVWAGTVELYAVVSSRRAVRTTVTVEAGRVTDVGDVPVADAGWARLRLDAPGADLDDGEVWIAELPFDPLEVDPFTGAAVIEPLAVGCYTARGALDGADAPAVRFCVGGAEEVEVVLLVTPPEDSWEVDREG